MTPAAAGWHGALDDFAAVLERQREALDAGRPQEVEAFAPPPGLGPLPVAMRPRAELLLAASRRLEADAAAALGAVGADLARARAASVAAATRHAPARPAFLDERV